MSNDELFNAVKDKVLASLKISPKLSHELATLCGYKSSTNFKTQYLSKFEESGLIEKIQGSNRWQLKGQKATQKSIIVDLTGEDDFYLTEVVKNWRERNTAKFREMHIRTFRGICLGKLKRLDHDESLNFNINPDSWNHPADTIKAVNALKEFGKSDELRYDYRIALRNALQYGMKIVLTQAESEALGISGKTNKADLSTLHISNEQVSDILLDEDIDSYHKNLFFFAYTTFFRPSTRYTPQIDNIEFYDRIVKYVILEDGTKITNSEAVKALSKNYKVEEFSHRAAMVNNTMEFKTMQVYPKYVWHDTFVQVFEKYVISRKHQGFKYLFWDDNKTIFNEKNYDSVVGTRRGKDNKYFTKMFFKHGFKQGDFGKQNDSNYAIRHMGVQKWLMITGYDYGKIMTLGWEDINTLIKWYGKRTLKEHAKGFGEILF